MIAIYKNIDNALQLLGEADEGCWINAVGLSPAEVERLRVMLDVPADFITSVLDPDERPRIEREDGAVLIILAVPFHQGPAADVPYTTVPVGVIMTTKMVATVSSVENQVLLRLQGARGLSTAKRNRFLLRLLYTLAAEFLADVRAIDKATDQLEDELQSSLRNKVLMDLLKYEKSLVYFTTALKSNEIILTNLQRSKMFQQYPEDQELLEDVLTEVQQAIEMTNISSNILSQMMDAFASIISNNLNVVMKFMAAATIMLSLPALVGTLYGMNVTLPAQDQPWAFAAVLGVSLIAVTAVGLVFWRRDWL